MVSNNQQFNGLPMPVFTAFGWTGEEAAINYALTQLELFIQTLHPRLPRELYNQFQHSGLDRDSQTVYLAAAETPSDDAYIAFYARPLSLQMMFIISDKSVLNTALKAIEKDPRGWYNMLTDLGPDWSLRVQQMELNPESGERTHYKDLYNDAVADLDSETVADVISKAVYLNSEDKWVTPISITFRIPAEQASVMGRSIIGVVGDHLRNMMPVMQLMTGQLKRKASRTRSRKAVAEQSRERKAAQPDTENPQDLDAFTYTAELMPLHIRRGFVNLTSDHWPFFAINARTTVRPVTLRYDGGSDDKSAVWRLVPNDMARLVLSEKVQQWLEDNFEANDRLEVRALKLENDTIEVTLSAL